MITKVEYFKGTDKIGEKTSEPFDEFTWENAPLGNHSISARLYVDGNLEATANSVNIQVIEALGYEQETIDFFSATNTPDNSDSSIYEGLTNHDCYELLDNVIKFYKSNGVWNDIVQWHPIFGDTAEKCGYNAKDVNSFYMNLNGDWTINSNGLRGIQDDTYGSLGFVPSEHLSLEDSGFSIARLSDIGSTVLLGAIEPDEDRRMYIQLQSGNTYVRIGSGQNSPISQNAVGIITGTRENGTVKTYVDGIELGSGASNATGLPQIESYYGAMNDASDATPQLSTTTILGSFIHHTASNPDVIAEGLRMWEEGLGRL